MARGPFRQKQPINPDAQASIFPTAAARSTTQRAPSHQAHQQRKGQADGDAEGVDRPHGAGITAAPLTVGQGDRGHRRQKAQRQHLPDPGRQRQHPADGGGRQMKRFKGLVFLQKHYEVMHTQSFEDSIEALSMVCRRNGGQL